MNETEIRYLQQEEKTDSRALYELCFPEDTKKFTDYYYKEKCRDNRIAALYCEGRMATMVHANPFTVSMYGTRAQVSYVVAVATHPDYRRRGLMQKLLGQVLCDCYKKGEPFSFLMPADPAYYESIGYRFWGSQTEWKLPPDEEHRWTAWLGRKIAERQPEPEIKAAWIADTPKRQAEAFLSNEEEDRLRALSSGEKENMQLADFTNRILARNFDLYIERNADYYRRLQQEQQSEDGDVVILRNENGELTGSFCYSAEDGIEIREPVFAKNMQVFNHPMMMGRIVHLQNFVKNLRFSTPFSETVSLKDDMIPENNGVFRIYIDAAGGRAERADTPEDAGVMDIAELGRILFGKMRIFINELV